jgi:predicted nucleic-acid-binding protein
VIAVDTNIVVRAIVDDDRRQVARVVALLDRNRIFVAATVLLETEWVLRGLYKLSRAAIADSLEMFCGLDCAVVQDIDLIRRAIDAYRNGADFADALHVLACEAAGVEQFATFDRQLPKRLLNLSTAVNIISP